MTTKRSTGGPAVVGLILHVDGTLRLFANNSGNLFAEVIGFQTDRGRSFLEQLAQLEDITCEILVCDQPATYGWGESRRLRHYRRAGTGGGTTPAERASAPRP
jgi:hypothetical protein